MDFEDESEDEDGKQARQEKLENRIHNIGKKVDNLYKKVSGL